MQIFAAHHPFNFSNRVGTGHANREPFRQSLRHFVSRIIADGRIIEPVKRRVTPKQPFPWTLWILALASFAIAYLFFILPRQLPKKPMKVEFVEGGSPQR